MFPEPVAGRCTLLDTESKWNVHKMFRRRPGHLLNVSFTFNLRPVSSVKKVFFKTLQNLLENTCAEVALKSQHVFFCEFSEILRIPTLQNASGRLLLFFIKNFSFSLLQRFEKVFFLDWTLIREVLALSQLRTRHPYDSGHSVLRLNFANMIWWWELSRRVE